MSDTTTIRISRATRDELNRLARDRHQTVAETVSRAVRLLRQDEIGRELASPLTEEEVRWLDADAG
jgi:Ribbon-helix-helix protein, copG family.